MSIKKNLNAVIKMIEDMQNIKYSSEFGLFLAYLYDIRDDQVPERVLKILDAHNSSARK